MRALALLVLAGCADLASSDPGLGAPLHVDGAQFRPGAFPAATGGPSVASVQTLHATVIVGENRETVSATLDPHATAAILGLDGYRGTWILPAGPPDFDSPQLASLHAGFGVELTPGPIEMLVAAADAHGQIGEPARADLVALDAPMPTGQLVVSLQWQGAADLDLHVVDPDGHEAWSGDPNTWKKPIGPADPEAWMTGGILDHDGNMSCTRDGEPTEDVVWSEHMGTTGPVEPIVPSGEYTVRVDARSMCGDASAAWGVTVTSAGEVIAAARGIATSYDATYQPHGAGAGVTALHFQL
ncbi:MAG TPA: hypothetical protein VLT45_16765 [Kofleriaceae bacterium]|nr:hypothetical protein [Kofleriaceae bacterium]